MGFTLAQHRVVNVSSPEPKMPSIPLAARSGPKKSLWRRLLWLTIFWSASVLTLGMVAMLFRLLMTAAGMRAH